MMSTTALLGFGGLLLACAGGLLFMGGGASERRLRERVQATRDLKVIGAGPTGDMLVDAPEEANTLTRLLRLMGYQADLPPPYAISLRTVAIASAIAGFGTFRLAQTVLPAWMAMPLAITAALAAAIVLFRRKTKAYQIALFRQIPDAMSLMLRAVRAGLPIAEAVRSVSRESISPTREEFNRVAGEVSLGLPIDVSLHRLYRRTSLQEYAFFSVIIGLHGQTGGNLSETLENLADMVRRRVAMAAKARALATEGRLSAIVVGALPFVVGILVSLISPGYMDEFVDNPKGPLFIAVFAVLLFLGLLTSHLLIQRSTQD